MDKRFFLSAACVCLFTLPACSSLRNAMGAGKNPPDEFRVLTKAPLVIPPEYNLRPPKPGAPRPQEMSSSEKARQALFEQGKRGSDAEEFLGAQAGARGTNPDIRNVLDAEAGIETKSEDLSRRLLSQTPGEVKDTAQVERLKREQAAQKTMENSGVQIDPSAQQEEKTNKDKSGKLPGL